MVCSVCFLLLTLQKRQAEPDSPNPKRFKFSEAEERDLKEVFQVLDKDNSGIVIEPAHNWNTKGAIDSSELKDVIASLGYTYTDEEVDQMIKAVDLGNCEWPTSNLQDGNNKITYDEFVNMMHAKMVSRKRDLLSHCP